jgi:hypothetical protein
MSDGMAFTDLEESLFGAEGTQVLRRTAGRLIALRANVTGQQSAGLSPTDAETCAAAFSAIDAAERILFDLSSSGD